MIHKLLTAILVIYNFLIGFGNLSVCDLNPLYEAEGQINLGLIINECGNVSQKSNFLPTVVNSAIWTIERINNLEISPLKFGITVFSACNEIEYFEKIFKLRESNNYLLGIVSTLSTKQFQNFCDILEIPISVVEKNWTQPLKITTGLLKALDLTENITVITAHEESEQEFFRYTEMESICVKNSITPKKWNELKSFNYPTVVLDDNEELILEQTEHPIIVVSLNGNFYSSGLPERSYVIQPQLTEYFQKFTKSPKILPTPLLFEISNPILNYLHNISNFITKNCNDTIYKFNCLESKLPHPKYFQQHRYKPEEILSILKIEPLADKFNYNVFRVENVSLLRQENATNFEYQKNTLQSFVKVFTYNIFDETLYSLEVDNFNVTYSTNATCSNFECWKNCINFYPKGSIKNKQLANHQKIIYLRPDSWVYAFLAISALGILFSIAIFIFLLTRMCKRDVLEGNPVLTIFLLFSVILMYSSVVPFALIGDENATNLICLMRSLSTTLSYAFSFSLILSRTILLATISKDVGFMSHVAGPIQSFLTLFIFAVQGALSLQIVTKCENAFRGSSFIYLLSYNVILLILLISLSPVIIKSQRNYKEGKYFTVAIFLISCAWSCWIPGYVILEDDWKDPIICLGLTATASILLGSIFIPRTYLMTISAARDRITSTLPSLATATSTLDIYRACTQPVYDCINVAAINAAAIARSGVTPPPLPPQPDMYTIPSDEDFLDDRCDTPAYPDKITRF